MMAVVSLLRSGAGVIAVPVSDMTTSTVARPRL